MILDIIILEKISIDISQLTWPILMGILPMINKYNKSVLLATNSNKLINNK